jgi:hypothetical protein
MEYGSLNGALFLPILSPSLADVMLCLIFKTKALGALSLGAVIPRPPCLVLRFINIFECSGRLSVLVIALAHSVEFYCHFTVPQVPVFCFASVWVNYFLSVNIRCKEMRELLCCARSKELEHSLLII